MYAVKGNDSLSVVLRQPFNDDNGGYISIDLALKNATEPLSTKGVVPCHLCVDGNDSYVVNYLSGNIAYIGKKVVTHSGKGINATRQDMPHTHQALFSPDKKYVLCCDLGLDTLFCYDRELNIKSKAKILDGYGIRHAVFSNDGDYVYAISELIPAIFVFKFYDGKLTYVKKYEIDCAKEKADGSAIRLSSDGTKLYCSLRVENALVVFERKNENLQFLQKVDCGGDSPRDFQVTDNYIIVTNEKSNSAVVFSLKNGMIMEKVEEISLKSPLCVVI